VEGLGVAAGELVQVRDHSGRSDVLAEVLLAIERRGATPLPEIVTPDTLRRLLQTTSASHLARWDRHRLRWMEQVDRVLVLEGDPLGLDGDAPAEAMAAWQSAVDRLTALEEERRLPYLLAAIPTAGRAAVLDRSLPDLEAAVVPALLVEAAALRQEIARVMAALGGARAMTILSGGGCALELALGDRRWLDDDGAVAAADRERGGMVSNLPGGSLYTAVIETETRGTLHLPEAEGATDVRLRFVGGAVSDVLAARNAESMRALFGQHTGDACRVGHIGIGLNPALGWTLVDEHVRGALFVSLGENRYMGGQNASSLNVDFALPNATLLVDGRTVVRDGELVV
jgi:leucyl aminopeptidase (aminopeptidase T)